MNKQLRHPLFDDVPWRQANAATSHVVTLKTSLPPGAMARKGYCPQITFPLADVSDETSLIETMFYGSTAKSISDFSGFADLFSTINPALAQNAANVIDAGGRGPKNSSAWLVVWSLQSVYMAYQDTETSWLRAGLVVEDWRYVVRIANVETERSDVNLSTLMSRALLRVPTTSGNAIKPVFYLAKKARHLLDKQTGRLESFQGAKIHMVDALRHTERPVMDQVA